ncbi:MAG: DUF5606 domain-containing protein [Muribaculaceae bacterium]|nr:DUF5606 domain-containing protein [Muribaculaceae bacterium]
MIRGILSITGKPGLYKLLSRGKNSLIVENIATKKRTPTYPHEKVISLADITMYTEHGDEPLPEIFDKIYTHTKGEAIDVKGFASDTAIRDYFGEILPDYDRDRVYTTDIRKLFSWYNLLVAAGITEFKDEEIAQDEAAEAAEAADEAQSEK